MREPEEGACPLLIASHNRSPTHPLNEERCRCFSFSQAPPSTWLGIVRHGRNPLPSPSVSPTKHLLRRLIQWDPNRLKQAQKALVPCTRWGLSLWSLTCVAQRRQVAASMPLTQPGAMLV